MVEKICYWVCDGETGLSSETMAFTAIGKRRGRTSHPYDPADLNRCIKLVDAVPEIKEKFAEISAISKEWKTVIDNWEELRNMFIEEAEYDWSKDVPASKTYDRMKELGL